MSYDKRTRAQEMSMNSIYKDVLILPLKMHFSPNNFEELKLKFIQILLWEIINYQVLSMLYLTALITRNHASGKLGNTVLL